MQEVLLYIQRNAEPVYLDRIHRKIRESKEKEDGKHKRPHH
jgi:hypothetical protein